MSLVPGRARRLESAISICLLAILLLIGVGVFLKQFDIDMERFGVDVTAAPKSEIPLELSSLLPAGFETLSKIEVYHTENLYEKINGKAPQYTESGFEKLFTRRFVSKDDENLAMELYVYDMSNARNAFSVYSVQTRADAEIWPDTQFGYKTGNALYLAHGKYYIELVGFSESIELLRAMEEVSQKIKSKLAVDKVAETEIAELGLFPQENIVAGSIKLYLANAFGFEGLTDTFAAQYKVGGQTVTAFFSKRPDKQDAQMVAESYYNFLIDNDGVAKPAADKILEGKIVDFYDTTEIVFATGPFVVGIHEAENQQAAEQLAVKLINKLSEAAK